MNGRMGLQRPSRQYLHRYNRARFHLELCIWSCIGIARLIVSWTERRIQSSGLLLITAVSRSGGTASCPALSAGRSWIGPAEMTELDPARVPNGHLLVVTRGESDLSRILRQAPLARVVQPAQVDMASIAGCAAIAVLGGSEAEPLILPARARALIDAQITRGTRVFAEYCRGIDGLAVAIDTVDTRHERLVWRGDDLGAVRPGDLLEDQAGRRLRMQAGSVTSVAPPLMQYTSATLAHRHVDLTSEPLPVEHNGIWFERENLLFSASRVANFHRARFAPMSQWSHVIGAIANWLTGQQLVAAEDRAYRVGFDDELAVEQAVRHSVGMAVAWFRNNELLVEGGRGGVLEGFATEITPEGRQPPQAPLGVRADCTGEAALAFELHHRLTGDEASAATARNLRDAFFDLFQVDAPGQPDHGMVRWAEGDWDVCYQDDVARGLIGHLLISMVDQTTTHMEQIRRALDFLISTTGTDGTREWVSTPRDLIEPRRTQLASTPGNRPSAHFNSHYAAALLLAGRIYREPSYVAIGVRCLATIMAAYPETTREMSETSEMCRLVFPLATLVLAADTAEHREWLYTVTRDLQRVRHESGGYLEWDTGYQARRSRRQGEESSLLVSNGDPVVDLLYSMNWLPMGFAQAYLATGDSWFRELLSDVSSFFTKAQLSSSDAVIDGAWARAFDVELGEVYGIPNDIEWGPWAIESGWTVAPIASGLAIGLLLDDWAPAYARSQADRGL
ncbi:hypothetical protein AB1K54_03045 [Microbacterium sp. BWT-B31]|uniref:hypothetical protein n=1 Tax=Microbacterium sp. BWT-B31 TaxID=3232072 RepID=UPI003526E8FA